MNNTTSRRLRPTRRSIMSLAHPGLIRLISEIDDNGPVQRGSLSVTFDDLSRNHLRHAINTARARGLITTDDTTPGSYRLTDSGERLADAYDSAARWARTHHYPAASSDFLTRVQRTLRLLPLEAAQSVPPDRAGTRESHSAGPLASDAFRDLQVPSEALATFLREHPDDDPHQPEPGTGNTPEETESAA